MERKIILNLAISLDGYICDEHGGFDWIVGHADRTLDTPNPIDFFEFIGTCDVVVMGKSAYDDAPENSLDLYNQHEIYVVTNSTEQPPQEHITFIKGDVVNQLLEKKKEEGKNIYIYGGAQIADLFIKEDAIDEYIIGIIPCILGKGRKLFLDNNPMIRLHLEQYSIADGVAMLRYIKK